MTLVRWRPARDLHDMRSEIDKVFHDFMKGTDTEETKNSWNPQVDIHENEDAIVFDIDIPGVKKEDIDVNVQDNILTISGHKEVERDEEKQNFHRIERFSGEYQRSFQLPKLVDTEKIKAKYNDGVLNINVPKREESKKKEVNINID
ncbi:MAG: Hsp20/alpha crystallin family protein [Candidatus Zixiibacteriota bacterium]